MGTNGFETGIGFAGIEKGKYKFKISSNYRNEQIKG